MKNYQSSPRGYFTPRVKAWLAIVILLGISALLGKAVWNIYTKNHLAKENKEATLRELADLEVRQKDIKAKLDKLKTVQGKEEEIRRNLPMAKEGEHVIVIVDKNSGNLESDKSSSTSPLRKKLWPAWLGGL